MKQAKIQHWLGYWKRANMVDIDQIGSLEDMHAARRFCACMRSGIFYTEGYGAVTTLDLWGALKAMRSADPSLGGQLKLDPAA